MNKLKSIAAAAATAAVAATALTVSPEGIDFIARWEGLGPTTTVVDGSGQAVKGTIAYQDVGGIWTICHGHTGGVKRGEVATFAQCRKYLEEDTGEAGDIIAKWVTYPVTQKQYDALVSFVLNLGPGIRWKRSGFVWLKNGEHSTLLKKINAGDCWGAADEFPKWNKVDGTPYRGLTNRRLDERALWITGCEVEEARDDQRQDQGRG